VTEREKFVIPVRAIGARALLDFPDNVSFNSSPVKVLEQIFSWMVASVVQLVNCVACLCPLVSIYQDSVDEECGRHGSQVHYGG